MKTEQMGVVTAAYAGCRERIGELLSSIDEERAAVMVPTCPDWSVHDVVAHLSGIVADVLTGRLDGMGTDPWTDAQVEERRNHSVAEILDEWNTGAPAFERLLEAIGDRAHQPVADVASHEHDIRMTLGEPGGRDSDAVRIGLGWVARQVIDSAAKHGASLRVRSTEGLDLGHEDADATLAGDSFELLRAMTGRRSIEQLRAMRWEGDFERALPGFWWLSLHPAETRIEE